MPRAVTLSLFLFLAEVIFPVCLSGCLVIPEIAEIKEEQVREKIGPEEVLLEYRMTETLLKLHAHTDKGVAVTDIPLDRMFWSSLEEFKSLLRVADTKNYLLPGRILGTFLILPVKTLLTDKKRLIIVPGDKLAEIPFEALIIDPIDSKSPRKEKIPFLIHEFEIIYHFSVAHWYYGVKTGRTTTYDFLGFSPVFETHPTINALPFTRVELDAIANLFRAQGKSVKIAMDQESDLTSFFTLSGKGKVVHLATHGLRAAENPVGNGLLFWEDHEPLDSEAQEVELLTPDDIALLRLNSDLLVLNACASGRSAASQDTMFRSSIREFFHAGARNILCTLWNVSDLMAQRFMISFYKHWLSGQSYSQALRAVKLEFLSKRETSLPMVWAPYVLIGQ